MIPRARRLIDEHAGVRVKIDPMDIAELKAELESLHSASFGWALSCCRRDYAAAEEVLQTVYLKILEGKARFRGEASLKTWLFAVIRKTAISEHRRNMLRKIVFMDGRETQNDHRATIDAPNLALEASETRQRFRAALSKLPPRQREALHLVFYQDLSLSEAAGVMGISVGSARQHYDRGKKHLREWLSQTDSNYGIRLGRKENPSAV